jgi:DNA polymerase
MSQHTWGRIRHSFTYYGAPATGRWSGQGLQPQNIPSRGLRKESDGSALQDIEVLIAEMRSHIHGKVTIADLSQIELRIQAWLIDDKATLDIFRGLDAGTVKHDLYKQRASAMMGKPIDKVTDDDRFIGKTCSLALGYQGGEQALARGFIGREAPDDLKQYVDMYRQANPLLVKYWYRLQDCYDHVKVKVGRNAKCGKIHMRHEEAVGMTRVVITLPNGAERYIWQRNGSGYDLAGNYPVEYYGGKIFNLLCQSICAEIMMEIMDRKPDDLIMTVHDELVWQGNHDVYDIMCKSEPWREDLPVNTTVLHSDGYTK